MSRASKLSKWHHRILKAVPSKCNSLPSYAALFKSLHLPNCIWYFTSTKYIFFVVPLTKYHVSKWCLSQINYDCVSDYRTSLYSVLITFLPHLPHSNIHIYSVTQIYIHIVKMIFVFFTNSPAFTFIQKNTIDKYFCKFFLFFCFYTRCIMFYAQNFERLF